MKNTKRFPRGVVSYEGRMDLEVEELCDALNTLPGVRTTESCCGHSLEPFRIYFSVDGAESMQGLFFLARCVDRRYWRHGYLWGIEVSVADASRDGSLPLVFLLHSGPIVGDDAYAQADSLVENMTQHLNHSAFLKVAE